MFAVIVNTLAIVAGALIGLLIRRGISEKLSHEVLRGLGLCTMIIGVAGAIKTGNILIMIVSVGVGVAVGEALTLEDRVNSRTDAILKKFSHGGNSSGIAEAFVTSCLIMNVGAMVIVGSLEAGLREDFTMLYTKSLLDFTAGIVLAATMGVGVLGSALFTLLFQGAIVLFSSYLAPLLSDFLINELSATGSALILAIGMNMVGITKFKVINYLPALLVVPFALKLVVAAGL